MSYIDPADFNAPWEMGPVRRCVALVACCLLLYSSYAIGQSATTRSTESARQVIANAKLGLFVHYVFGLTQAAPGQLQGKRTKGILGGM